MTRVYNHFDAKAIPRNKVIRLQIITIIIAGYTAVNILFVEFLGDYLFHDGLVLLVTLFLVPLTCVLIAFAIFFKKTFKQGQHSFKKVPPPASKNITGDAIMTSFFPEGLEARMASRELRPELAKLHGDLIAGTEEETLPRINEYLQQNHPSFLGGCGDVISKNLLKTDFYPDVIIIDGQTRRQDYKDEFPPSYQQRTVENVTGGVTRSSWFGIKDVIESQERTIIMVTGGEEDLLLIPLVMLAPENAIVAYGQPPITDIDPPIPAGAVMIKVTSEVKQHFASMFEKFNPTNREA